MSLNLFPRLWISSRMTRSPFVICRRYLSDSKIPKPAEFSKRRVKEDSSKGKGPVSWVNAIVSGVALSAVIGTYLYVKDIKTKELDKERKREIGKSKIGGQFKLFDTKGNPKSSEDFHGKWVLLYFGFTHCPDVCPDEMEKIAAVVDDLAEKRKTEDKVGQVVPVFITVDPDRDTGKVIEDYVKEFHPDMIGLTGTTEQIKEACKAYRVYFSAGPRDEDDDYIVDHTIITYLVDPNGNFVDYYGQRKVAKDVAHSIQLHMMKFANQEKRGMFS